MNSQPGWSVYVLLVTLTCITLLSLHSLRDEPSDLRVGFDARTRFARQAMGTDSADHAQRPYRNHHWQWPTDCWTPHTIAAQLREFVFQKMPLVAAQQACRQTDLAAGQGPASTSRSSSSAVLNQPIRRPIWRQAFWKAHAVLAKQAWKRTQSILVQTASWIHHHDLAERRRLADQLAFGPLTNPVLDVRAPAPPALPSLGEPEFPSSVVKHKRPWQPWYITRFETIKNRVASRVDERERRFFSASLRLNASTASAESVSAEPVSDAALSPAVVSEESPSDVAQPIDLEADTSSEPVTETPVARPRPRRTSRTTWPYPEGLAYRVHSLRDAVDSAEWSDATLILIDQLSRIDHHGAAEVESCLEQLRLRHAQLAASIPPTSASSGAVAMRVTAYELQKWIEIWSLVYQSATHGRQAALSASTQLDSEATESLESRRSLAAAIEAVSLDLERYEDSEAWRQFLELEELRRAVDLSPLHVGQNPVVERVLMKFEVARLNSSQARLLGSRPYQQLYQSLLPLTFSHVDVSEFLWHLVMYEQQPWNTIESRLTSNARRLGWSQDPHLVRLGEFVESHFRNANLRIAVSEVMLNRLVPPPQAMNEPVSDVIMGARVMGHSNTSNRLSFRLVPDPHRLHVDLIATGEVQSRTRAMKGFFVFHNRGLGHYVAEKDIVITPEQLFTNPARVSARNSHRTTGVESDFDSVPLLGSFIRSLAMEQNHEMAPLARRIAQRKISGTAQQRMDREVDTRLSTAREQIDQRVVSPLDSMAIGIDPVEFRTTSERMIMRYRVAGHEQLSAFSARPQALANSMMSMQIHQSVLNNLARRLDLNGREFQIAELYEHLSGITGRNIEVPADLDRGVHVQFAPSDCIEFRFIDDRVQVTLRFAELRVGRGSRWRNVAIEADYVPQLDGLQVNLVRVPESTLRLPGRQLGFRDQMAIRTIFNKVFDVNQVLPATPEDLLTDARFQDLEVSQCEIRDGWVGLSLGTR